MSVQLDRVYYLLYVLKQPQKTAVEAHTQRFALQGLAKDPIQWDWPQGCALGIVCARLFANYRACGNR